VRFIALFVDDGYVHASCICADDAFIGVISHAVKLFGCSPLNVVLYASMYCASCESGGITEVVVDLMQPATDRDATIRSARTAASFFAIRFAFFNVLSFQKELIKYVTWMKRNLSLSERVSKHSKKR
jgi:hypothetical protein